MKRGQAIEDGLQVGKQMRTARVKGYILAL
jgi:hypothetical protein